ncbi:PIR Superfamily Protein [Plasmodium ovale wallikeri]|uniref:Plasmodium vivax Vir protein, putative n=2 Tax=Plasmodium ovale TaxID=36330 RepID=A0A1C3KJ23_PLAOA|nr:PIR Superfamily Protein [Plasmodium ovale wallikeri]SBT73872.1 Plasmodium vivax Vir protein, putative [Plasmodium ovale]
MPCEKGAGKYKFCLSSNYYEVLLKYAKDHKITEQDQKCDNLSTIMEFSEDADAKNICLEFKSLYKSFIDYPVGGSSRNDPFSNYDCDFLNYWLNDKLGEKVNNGSIKVKEFYEAIKKKDEQFFSKNKELGDYIRIIDPNILENMKILYELFYYKQKILDIMIKEDNSDNAEKLCPEYMEKCYDNYIKGMNKCLNGYDDFYMALKFFERDYKYLIEKEKDESGYCKISDNIRLPENDIVLEAKQRRIMTTKIMNAPLILLFVIPLLYKYTPLGPFLRTKINMVKNKWMNQDKNGKELLSLSTDIEDNINDIEMEYNIGYYS